MEMENQICEWMQTQNVVSRLATKNNKNYGDFEGLLSVKWAARRHKHKIVVGTE